MWYSDPGIFQVIDAIICDPLFVIQDIVDLTQGFQYWSILNPRGRWNQV